MRQLLQPGRLAAGIDGPDVEPAGVLDRAFRVLDDQGLVARQIGQHTRERPYHGPSIASANESNSGLPYQGQHTPHWHLPPRLTPMTSLVALVERRRYTWPSSRNKPNLISIRHSDAKAFSSRRVRFPESWQRHRTARASFAPRHYVTVTARLSERRQSCCWPALQRSNQMEAGGSGFLCHLIEIANAPLRIRCSQLRVEGSIACRRMLSSNAIGTVQAQQSGRRQCRASAAHECTRCGPRRNMDHVDAYDCISDLDRPPSVLDVELHRRPHIRQGL